MEFFNNSITDFLQDDNQIQTVFFVVLISKFIKKFFLRMK
ncbi:hypothetical protein LEP1GSC021_0566 [Leptospira noguchii str. 1993005606]|uniref:Uncharacterized protein n=4 Tax=Leptospira noguchii TaxID=28182 RepID=M6YN34_9LEPT|nr:hypothetical protein LEP1GSC041_3238 [Leptospira noguchii str. 2006001870]EMM99488.1 hypothetical protein LEP1GSC035_1154 [Leptospira noguchii str. 2007001578]EMO27718.1 hypothetical protein LEP1GSC170_4124 [Leptospira interrogans serovar Bataviae str. HAI135]EMO42352.1 hypothetical protein LEP1GSC186_4551 [Leptospira noguchii serovar Autumnalis str. ZUN142]EMO87743.1 hypothetical protein LEP1GSC024_3560 [Leptospira noguchii str. 2001034031]EMS86311.1 hypothetical protein LEP1GSC074_0581 [L